MSLRLTGLYVRCALWYLLAAAVLWLVGIEGIYGHPTPFYAVLFPAFETWLVPGTVLLAMYLLYNGLREMAFAESGPLRWRITLKAIPAVAAALVLAWGASVQATRDGIGVLHVVGDVWAALRWHLLAVGVFTAFAAVWWKMMGRVDWFGKGPPKQWSRRMVAGLVVFCFMFSGAVAMVRGGTKGISSPYERHGYEYVDDIGIRPSIRALFRDYAELHPHLSMHAKVHPPGPIVMLWLMSYVVLSRSAMVLALGTMAVGSLGIIPLYLWARDLSNERVALTCATLYTLMPSIVLFTATSADIMFMPLTLTTLFLFWRAIHLRSIPYAAVAGAMYAVLSLTSFSLIAIGAFFGFVGLWRLSHRGMRLAVVQTAAVMLITFLAVHVAVRWWSGFDIIECFRMSRAQFDEDQFHVDMVTPRFSGWTWRFINPLCWVFFAGIPVSVLFFWRLARPERASKGMFITFGLTLVVLTLLYLARGEGERSAMYVLPFVVLPAAHLLDQLGKTARSYGPMVATFVFLGVQCWLIESCLYTYW
jgi:hypothetical protein